jgi:hypothetical protein
VAVGTFPARPTNEEKQMHQSDHTDIEQLIQELDGGAFFARLGRALSQSAAGSVNHRSKSEVTVKFTMKPIGDARQVEIDHTITYVEPTPRGKVTETHTTSTPMYVTTKGKLTLFPEQPTKDMFRGEESK